MTFFRNHQYAKPALSAALLLATVLTGCSDDADSTITVKPPQADDKFGIWEQTGYGDIAVLDANGAEVFQYTRQGCLQADSLNNNEVADYFDRLTLSEDGSSLITDPEKRLDFDIRLDRLAALPESCQPGALITATTPTATFEHLWHTFNDHYAFFQERGVDWNALYAELKPLVTDDLDDDQLLAIFEALLEPLDDGHVQLETDDDDYDFEQLRGANKVVIESFQDPSEFASEEQWNDALQAYANTLAQKFVQIRSSYIDDGTHKFAGGSTGRRVSWGTIDQNLGYLRVARMTDLGAANEDSVEADLRGINSIMKNALSDLENTSGLIIDVRNNGGGEDAVSLAIASYFSDEQRLAASKFSRSYAGNTAVVEAYINPAMQTPYLQPIAVIGASDTSSAAEIFLMAMSALPNVTLVGENSNGILSDLLSKTLPNGWEISLSNEVFTDYQGVNHEVTGVPPQVRAATFSIEAIEQNRDAAIDAAIATLGF